MVCDNVFTLEASEMELLRRITEPALPDVPIFKSKLNVPRGTGSVPLFGDNSTMHAVC